MSFSRNMCQFSDFKNFEFTPSTNAWWNYVIFDKHMSFFKFWKPLRERGGLATCLDTHKISKIVKIDFRSEISRFKYHQIDQNHVPDPLGLIPDPKKPQIIQKPGLATYIYIYIYIYIYTINTAIGRIRSAKGGTHW